MLELNQKINLVKNQLKQNRIKMKNLTKIMLWMAVLPLLFVMSCKDDDPAPAEGKFGELSTYLQENSLDLDNVLDGWIIGAPAATEDVPAFLATYDIFDIRGASDYDAGHLEGAVNTTLGNIVADAANATKPVLVVCYTGQTASHAVVALRLSGQTDAKVLKWGMSGWNSNNSAPWEGALNSQAVGNANWTFPASPADAGTFDYPSIESTASDAALLAERVTAMTTKGFQGVNASDVLASPDSYLINNYWAETDNTHYGHIIGAIRNNTMTLANGGFTDFDPAETIVTYCWTGQTSSMITAYLTVLGYDAKSLKFGSNNMIYSELESHKFAPPAVDLPVVTD